MNKLILHIPHSSTFIPCYEGYVVNNSFLQNEILQLTDWYTDELYHSENDITIKAEFSRIFCDPERFTDDTREVMAQYGMGVLYKKSDSGKIIREVSSELRQRVLKEYYNKHHERLYTAVNNQLRQYNNAWIVDCHSFPDKPFKRDLNKNPNRPDFNIGTNDFHTPPKLLNAALDFFRSKGYSVGIDWPYSGTLVPLAYSNKNRKVKSIMLEINRKLYLKDSTNKKTDGFTAIQKITQEFLKEIRSAFLAML